MYKQDLSASNSLGTTQIASNCCANGGKWLELLATYVIVCVLALTEYLPNTKVLTVEILLLAQRWPYNYSPTMDFEIRGPMMDMIADCNGVISLYIRFILIMQKKYMIYNLIFMKTDYVLQE